jgi:cytochrome c-type biogenesis protein CcmH
MIRRLFVPLVLMVALAAPAFASESNPTLAELEDEIICPTCHTTLALSSSPIAERMRAFISRRIAAGDTKSEIKDRLVAEFGEGVLAAPPARGFNILAWALPIAGGIAAIVVIGLLARRWATERPSPPALSAESSSADGRALEPELERRLDEELAGFDA